jgi:lipoprotein
MKTYILLIFALLIIGCGNQSQSRCDSAILVPVKSFSREIADRALWRELSHDDNEYFPYIDSARLDWSQVVNHYLSTKHPNSKQLILTWGKNQRFDITQTPRLNDIHYIDTLLSLCYYCTFGQLSSPFERELEKYISLPITFNQTLPLLEHNPKNSEVDSLLKKATDGIRIFHTPDKKYKIYCCEDRSGSSGRFYSVYLQYVKDGEVKWNQIADWIAGKYSNQQIDKIYTFLHNGQTYYVLISYCYIVAYFEIATIENGNFITHSEFYPKQFQNNIKDGSIEFYDGSDSYFDLEFDSQALTINYTFYSYMGEVEEHGQKFPQYKKTEQKTVKLNIE